MATLPKITRGPPTSIRTKAKKQAVKTLLTTPYSLNWPSLPSEDEELICEEIKRLFTSLGLSKPTKPDLGNVSDLTIKEKNALKKEKLKQTWTKSAEIRRNLTFGLQQAIRCLEKNELCALLVCRDVKPFMMIEPLLPLCASRGVSSAALHNLGSTLQTALNFKSCRALGFKGEVAQNDKNIFHNLFKLIKRKVLPLPTVFNQLPDVLSDLPIPPNVTAADTCLKRDSVLPTATDAVILQDYSHLYIKKSDIKLLKLPIEGEFLCLERDPNVNQWRKRKANESEYISDHLRSKKYKGMKFKQLKAVMATMKNAANKVANAKN